MGYILQYLIARCYQPSDDVLKANDPETYTEFNGWIKLKEMRLIAGINPDSKFRFKFSLRGSGNEASYGQIYRNSVAVGTLQSVPYGGTINTSEDINISGWNVGDTIELWGCSPTKRCTVYNFRLCGVGSEFYNSLV